MASHLGWAPIEETKWTCSTAMKYALIEGVGNGDDSTLNGIVMGRSSLNWLTGIMVGRSEGDDLYDDAKALHDAIDRHGSIRFVYPA